jgi:hypothetical protein
MACVPIPFVSTEIIIESELSANLIHIDLIERRTSEEEKKSHGRFLSSESLILGRSDGGLMLVGHYKVLFASSYFGQSVFWRDFMQL